MMRALIGFLLICATVPAAAQGPDPVPDGLEVSVGAGWIGGVVFDGRDATLRQAGPPPAAMTLFRTETRLTSAPGLEVSAAWWFGRRLGLEAGFLTGHPDLRTSVSADAEGVPPITVAERIDQYIVEGRVLVLLDELRLGQRTVPFVTAGGGYLRQLHEGLTFIEEGHVIHVGGGVRHALWSRTGGFLRAAGLRADARVYWFSGGLSLDDKRSVRPSVSGALFMTF